jgi:NAD(P)H-nitrite reductase large subunit
MANFKYLIIGGGVAGATAAETIRDHDKEGTIGLVNDEPYTLYSRVMLSKPAFFLEKIPFDSVWLKNQEWYQKNNVTFIGGKKAAGLDTAGKTITLEGGADGAAGETIGYEKLLLATGVCARTWEVQGADKQGIYYLRTLEDAKKIIAAIKTAKKATTIGSGFISFEMSDLLRMAGLEVTAVYLEDYYWKQTVDEASGKMIEAALERMGVKLMKRSAVAQVLGTDHVEGVLLKDGTKLDCDMVVCGIGAYCAMDWIQKAGVAVNRGIVTDEYLQTNAPDIWAAGDIAEFKDLIAEEMVQEGNWVNAHEQGRIAALNMTGTKEPFKFVSFYTTQGSGITIAFAGDVRPLPDRTVVRRGSPEVNSYARLLIVGKELVGATMINRTQELTTVTNLIKNNVDVSGKLQQLADPNFDLKTLL